MIEIPSPVLENGDSFANAISGCVADCYCYMALTDGHGAIICFSGAFPVVFPPLVSHKDFWAAKWAEKSEIISMPHRAGEQQTDS